VAPDAAPADVPAPLPGPAGPALGAALSMVSVGLLKAAEWRKGLPVAEDTKPAEMKKRN
jgi:hypothetical protein